MTFLTPHLNLMFSGAPFAHLPKTHISTRRIEEWGANTGKSLPKMHDRSLLLTDTPI